MKTLEIFRSLWATLQVDAVQDNFGYQLKLSFMDDIHENKQFLRNNVHTNIIDTNSQERLSVITELSAGYELSWPLLNDALCPESGKLISGSSVQSMSASEKEILYVLDKLLFYEGQNEDSHESPKNVEVVPSYLYLRQLHRALEGQKLN